MTVSAPVELSGVSQATQRKNISGLIAAVSIGNALEWYDIAIYGYFAVYVSKAFFPNNDSTTSLLTSSGSCPMASSRWIRASTPAIEASPVIGMRLLLPNRSFPTFR